MPLRQVDDGEGNGAGEGGLVGFSGPRADRLTKDARTGTGASLWQECASLHLLEVVLAESGCQ